LVIKDLLEDTSSNFLSFQEI